MSGHPGWDIVCDAADGRGGYRLERNIAVPAVVVPHCGMLGVVKDEAEVREITVLLLPKFKAEATELIGADGIEAVAAHLSEHPGAGDVIPGSGGALKLRWAAKGKGKRGGARVIYVYVVVAGRVYLLRCYAKNVKTDLTAIEKKELRQIAAYLKGMH